MDSPRTARLAGFPRCRLLALVDETAGLERALQALTPHVERAVVQVLSGPRGVHVLDVSGASRGLWGRVRRWVQDVAYDRSGLALHEGHLLRGGHLLLVPVRGGDRAEQLARVLAEQGAHGLLWFGRCSVVDVTPRRRAVRTRAVLVAPDRVPVRPLRPVAALAA